MISSQSVMDAKTAQLESNAYRATMPGIIALAIAIIIIVMFSYLIDLYYVTPVLKITEGLRNYLNSKIPFKVTMEGVMRCINSKYIETMIGLLKNKKTNSVGGRRYASECRTEIYGFDAPVECGVYVGFGLHIAIQ